MHEMHQARELVRQALAAGVPGVPIRVVRLAVGEASGHSPAHLAEHFAEAARDTLAAGASLECVVEKLAACCADCGQELDPGAPGFACRQCGSAALRFTAGRGVRLIGVS